MLLRRITQHVKDQNWTAVALDFAIVVIGVFLGLQFANWNTARLEAREEQQILIRLQAELETAIEVQVAYRSYADQRLDDLSSARLVLLGLDERTELTASECEAVAESYLPLTPFTIIPSVEELSTSGKLALIEDARVIAAIAALSAQIDIRRVILEETRNVRLSPSVEFPDYITYELVSDDGLHNRPDVDGFDPSFTCDTAAMKADGRFLNVLGQNVTNVYFLVEVSNLPMEATLSELKAAVDDALTGAR